MSCCTECFEDSTLKNRITEQGKTGDCDYCESTDVAVCDTTILRDEFLVVIGLYEPVEVGVNALFHEDQFRVGEPLAELIQEDWEIFTDSVEYDTRSRLLNDIVNTLTVDPKEAYESDIDVDQLWTDKENQLTHRTHGNLWDYFVDHIKTKRRFVFDESSGSEIIDPREWVPDFLEGVDLDHSIRLFRARLGSLSDVKPFPPERMGAPPPNVCPHGRANSKGIPVLYAATDEQTAVHEIRPWKGAMVSVGEIALAGKLRTCDLAQQPYLSEGPFVYGESWKLAAELEQVRMMRRFAHELSRPIDPNQAEIDYLPTQYLTEIVMNCGFDAVLYPSSLGSGKNIAIFDPALVEVNVTRLGKIDDVAVSYSLAY